MFSLNTIQSNERNMDPYLCVFVCKIILKINFYSLEKMKQLFLTDNSQLDAVASLFSLPYLQQIVTLT